MKVKMSILVIVIMAIIVMGISGVLLWKAGSAGAEGNVMAKFIVVLLLFVLAGAAMAVMVFVALCYITRPIDKDISGDEWDLPHTISGGE